jgi:hypothetical protein
MTSPKLAQRCRLRDFSGEFHVTYLTTADIDHIWTPMPQTPTAWLDLIGLSVVGRFWVWDGGPVEGVVDDEGRTVWKIMARVGRPFLRDNTGAV